MKSQLAGRDFEEVYIDEPDGLAMAAFHGIMSVPVLQLLDERGVCVKQFYRAEDIDNAALQDV